MTEHELLARVVAVLARDLISDPAYAELPMVVAARLIERSVHVAYSCMHVRSAA